ncbi:G-type lectin S-receptor-like serine/threonine-protein kinase RLK1 [Panicum miliaceum]|uniref:non-specific serine/threonine protein kinase n=1 Tax=Panicum miliaceum TaxID=4540 RepID=A0A3L6PXY1_PANMI|nr:G-type lectin S-receptor-like serine/threonine-protein kinase RLK1 [Panicum miliaceum]
MAPLLLLPILLLLSSPYVQAQQIITLGSSLTPQGPNSFWLSPSGDFAFGFWPIEGNTSSYLLAVWFNKISDKTVAWYAKTTDPDPALAQVSSSSCLRLTSNGALSLQDPIGTEVWSPEVVGAAYAAVLDTGNFVLAAADGSTKWGTFDNPADTILPSQVLTPGTKLHSRIIATPMAGAISSMADYYHRATLDSDGVFREYLYPKKFSNLYNQAWSVLDFKAPNIYIPRRLAAETNAGSGTCGFNSYNNLAVTNNQTTCVCLPQYSFIDQQSKDKGCKPDFQPPSCDLDEAGATKLYTLKMMSHVDWPGGDYQQLSNISKKPVPAALPDRLFLLCCCIL